jgi:two-component system, cell cycle response regulator DivK
MRILVVEDDPANLAVFTQILTMRGYKVYGAASGREAFEIIIKTPIDALVLDLSLPGMDGLAVARALKGSRRYSSIPILAVTGGGMAYTERAARAAGCGAYLLKPFQVSEFTAELTRLLVGRLPWLMPSALSQVPQHLPAHSA